MSPPDEPVLVRVHSECLTGDVFGSLRCDCGEQVSNGDESDRREKGAGVFLYMRQEGRGIGFHNKIRAYALQDKGHGYRGGQPVRSASPPTCATTASAPRYWPTWACARSRLLTNNPKKVSRAGGLRAEGRGDSAHHAPPNPHNRRYLETKQKKMGHL